MDFRVKIRPTKHIGRTLQEAISKSVLRHTKMVLNSHGTYLTTDGNYFTAFAYNAQKFRGKRSNKPLERVTRWEIHVYAIPLDVLRNSGLKIHQSKHTFKLVPRE